MTVANFKQVSRFDFQHVSDIHYNQLHSTTVRDSSLVKKVMDCKDRTGMVKRIAAYLPTATEFQDWWRVVLLDAGNPRFRWFMDGSSGAKIVKRDLANIAIVSKR